MANFLPNRLISHLMNTRRHTHPLLLALLPCLVIIAVLGLIALGACLTVIVLGLRLMWQLVARLNPKSQRRQSACILAQYRVIDPVGAPLTQPASSPSAE